MFGQERFVVDRFVTRHSGLSKCVGSQPHELFTRERVVPDVKVGHRNDDRVEVITTSERGERTAVRIRSIVVVDLPHVDTVREHTR